MPKLKTLELESQYIAGLKQISLKVTLYVNADGEFYCEVPEALQDCFDMSRVGWGDSAFFRDRRGRICMKDSSYGALVGSLQNALDEIARPNEIREKVICYYIESQGSFAIDSAGGIHRDLTGNVDAQWFDKTSNSFGCMATPYSLSIAAGVYWRITRSEPFRMAFLIVSFGTLPARALSRARRRRELLSGSAPLRAATMISRTSFVHKLERLAS